MKRKRFAIGILTILLSMVCIVLFFLIYVITTSKGNIQSQDTIVIDFTSKVVAIDSGHGGIYSGKVSSSGIKEKHINLAIAKKLQVLLEDVGITVVMTRVDDNGLYDEWDYDKKVTDLAKRCEIINNSNADIAISIHQNDYVSSSATGGQMFYYTKSVEGKKLADIMQQMFKDEINPYNKRAAKSDSSYYMLLHTTPPTIIAECGFLSNYAEAAKLNTEEYQQQVAQTLYDGIIKYFTSDE